MSLLQTESIFLELFIGYLKSYFYQNVGNVEFSGTRQMIGNKGIYTWMQFWICIKIFFNFRYTTQIGYKIFVDVFANPGQHLMRASVLMRHLKIISTLLTQKEKKNSIYKTSHPNKSPTATNKVQPYFYFAIFMYFIETILGHTKQISQDNLCAAGNDENFGKSYFVVLFPESILSYIISHNMWIINYLR